MPDTPEGATNPPAAVILAFDFGLRRIGVAAGNNVTCSATPLTTLTSHADQPPWPEIDQLVAEWCPTLLVVGQPADVNDSSIAAEATAFSAALADRYQLPVKRVDETLTSSAAAAELAEARRSGRRKRRVNKAMIDSHAARLIAEQYLNTC